MHTYQLYMADDLNSAITELRAQLTTLSTQVKESDVHLSKYFDVPKISTALHSILDKNFGQDTLEELERLTAALIQVKEIADLGKEQSEPVAQMIKTRPSLIHALNLINQLSDVMKETDRLLNLELIANSDKKSPPGTIFAFSDQSIRYSLDTHSFDLYREFNA
ncbi:hypothetical protein [Legionella sp. WA2022007384]